MQNPIYVGVSGQISLARRMETIAQNMANVNTPGFRAEGLKFDTLVSPIAREDGAKINFVSAGKSFITTDSGAITQTGNALDVALNGDSYFSLQTPVGQTYTRDGRMLMTPDGGLVSVMGYPYLDAGGAPIQIDPNAGVPSIATDGAIYQDDVQVAALGLFQFQPDTTLKYGPNSSLIPDKQPIPIQGNEAEGVMQGFVESSNVNGVIEMTRLVEVTRAFDQMEALLRQQEEMGINAIQTLGGKNQ